MEQSGISQQRSFEAVKFILIKLQSSKTSHKTIASFLSTNISETIQCLKTTPKFTIKMMLASPLHDRKGNRITHSIQLHARVHFPTAIFIKPSNV